jgi:uncharacterized protein YcbX
MARVEALFVYPIKGCRGTRMDAAPIGARGFEGDRRWMIVDDAGVFVTQRTAPRLVLVRPALLPAFIPAFLPPLDQSGSHPGGASLTITGPDGAPAPIQLPAAHETGDELPVQVWSHRGLAVRHAAGSAWFSRFLGGPHNLVYMADRHLRPVNPERARPGDIVGFADAYPFLLLSQASLDDLNRRLSQPITVERFRPNIVVSGCDPFAEDGWARLAIGDIPFRGVKRCDRCTVTTVDLDTAARGPEPLRTLATFRKQDGKVWFGMNLIHDRSGTVRVGDAVTIGDAAP